MLFRSRELATRAATPRPRTAIEFQGAATRRLQDAAQGPIPVEGTSQAAGIAPEIAPAVEHALNSPWFRESTNRGADRSAGAAQADLARGRYEKAQALGIKLTEPEALRDESLLAEQDRLARTPGEITQPLRDRYTETNKQALDVLSELELSTGAEKGTTAEAGGDVIAAMDNAYKKAKERTSAAYEKWKESSDADVLISADKPINARDDRSGGPAIG